LVDFSGCEALQLRERAGKEKIRMEQETRIAVIGIMVEDKKMAGEVNGLLHEYGQFIIGRMGLPYEKKGINIISVVVDAPMDTISALSGKLGRLPGVGVKALYSKEGAGRQERKER